MISNIQSKLGEVEKIASDNYEFFRYNGWPSCRCLACGAMQADPCPSFIKHKENCVLPKIQEILDDRH